MENYLTKREEAYSIHQRILTNGKIVQSALLDMCKDLKHMRDEGLYQELGYDTFEDYSEQACGIKQRQAYSYISAYEKLGEGYMQENASLGITKLELISQISSYEREEFLEKNDVEELSTRELKKQVEEFKNQIEQLTFNFESASKENAELTQQLKDIQDNMVDSTITAEIDTESIKDAVSKAVEEAKAETADEINKLKNQLKEQQAKVKAAEDSKKAEIKKATAEANEKANKKIDKLLKEKSDADEKLKEALKSAKAANADEDVTAVRFLFNNLQSTANEIKEHITRINQKNSEQATKLSAVMIKVFDDISKSLKYQTINFYRLINWIELYYYQI